MMEFIATTELLGFVLPDGRLDFGALLEDFAAFWQRYGEMLDGETDYRAAARVVVLARLHRVARWGGFVDREYAAGLGRLDLLIRKPYGRHQVQREAVELEVWQEARPDPLQDGLARLDAYLEYLMLDTGTLIVFDQRADAPPIADRTRFRTARTPTGRSVTVLRA
jgi:hypothetical protein